MAAGRTEPLDSDPAAPRADLGLPELQALLRVIAAVSPCTSLGPMGTHAVNGVVEELGLDGAALLLPVEADAAWQVQATTGLPPGVTAALAAQSRRAWDSDDPSPDVRGPLCGHESLASLPAVAAAEGIASLGLIPLVHDAHLVGAIALAARTPRRLTAREQALAAAIAQQVASALARARQFQAEQSAREAAERNTDRMRRLARVGAALSSALVARDVGDVIVSEGKAAIGAETGTVFLLDNARSRLTMLPSAELPPGVQCFSYPLDGANPLSLAARLGQPVWLENREDYARRFPESEARVREAPRGQPAAFACLPLRIEDQTIGGLAFTFAEARRFDDDERAFIGLLAHHCAQGMERARLYERALDAVRVRDDFLSVAGHELRTPLATLLMQTQSLLGAPDELPDAKIQERSGAMLRTLRRLVKLADELLDITRIRAGRLRLEVEPMELTSHVREVAARTLEGLRGPRPELRVQACDQIEGHWDPLRLEQLVANLITNACKYGGGQPIDVEMEKVPAGAALVVRDRGIGIAPADQSRIFERFERVVEPGDFTGLGLGLWIAREIAMAHGGQISVRSQLGQGAEFSVLLPLDPPAPVSPASPPHP